MAHRLPPAGVLTPQSEHYVNYIVIPKPSTCSVHSDAANTSCSMRPKFLCLRQPPAQTSFKCVDLCQPLCPASPVECAYKATCHHHHKTRCPPMPCPCCPCCVRKEVNVVSPICCCSDTDCCCEEGPACAIKITLPRSDDKVVEEKMKKKLKRLMTDVEKFDQALACLANRKMQTIECVSDHCTQRCYCCRPKPMPVREICCVPRFCRTKPVAVNCRPFHGKKKSVYFRSTTVASQLIKLAEILNRTIESIHCGRTDQCPDHILQDCLLLDELRGNVQT